VHPEIDRYAHLESPIHSWDPALKLAGFTLYVFALASLGTLLGTLAGLAVSLLLLRLSRISIAFTLDLLKPLLFFLVPFFLLLPLRIERHGADLGVGWDWDQVRVASVLSLRAFAIALAIFPMFGTAPFHLSMKSLQDLGVPKMLVQSLLFTYRYLFVYLEQLRKMKVAMRSRGFQPKFDLRTFKTYGYQVGMLLVTSYEQTERILSAMKSRGYDGTLRLLYQPRRVPLDWWKFAAMTALVICLFAGDRLWLS
jgi:cobalt/nickel transport system permease protein